MSVIVHLPSPLKSLTGGRRRLTLDGSPRTVGEALAAVAARYPQIGDRLMTETGQLRPYVNVFLGRGGVHDTAQLDTPLPSGADLTILPGITPDSEQS